MILKVENMSCEHCKGKIEKALFDKKFTNVTIDLAAGTVEVEAAEKKKDKIIKIIESKGYKVNS